MQIRRPLVAVLTALTLVGGGGVVTACGDPVESETGTPKDTAENTTSGDEPSEDSQGNVPDNTNKEPGSDEDSGSGTGDQ
jgi:hypothetical protein